MPTLATIILLPILLGLSYWQWQRAEQKTILQTAFAERLEQAPVPVDQLAKPAKQRYRWVTVTGQYDSAHQLLLGNQVRDGQVGYLVYTPLQLNHEQAAILVNRGWIEASAGSLADVIKVEPKPRNISGQIGGIPNPGIWLENPAGNDWPKIMQHIDIQALENIFPYPVADFVILLDPAASDGYLRNWQPSFGTMNPERHIGYAVQWLALAITLMALFIGLNLKRVETTS